MTTTNDDLNEVALITIYIFVMFLKAFTFSESRIKRAGQKGSHTETKLIHIYHHAIYLTVTTEFEAEYINFCH